MARKKQRLINYHTSSLTSMPLASDVHYGEIVVRHNEQQPELLIKVNESEFGVIPGSGAVASAISVAVKNVTDNIDAANGRIETISGNLNTFKTEVADTYETKENVTTAITAAKDSVYASATTAAAADAQAKANSAKTDAINAAAASAKTLNSAIEGVDDRVDTVSGNLNTFKTDVASTYETKNNVTTAITAAKDSVYASATTAAAADAQAKANSAKTDAINAAAVSANTLLGIIDSVDDKVDADVKALADYKTEVSSTYETKNNVTTAITAAKDSVYASATTAAAADATTKVNSAKEELNNAITAATNTLQNKIDGVDGKVDALSGNVHTTIENLESALTETINNKVSAAYRFQGSCKYAELENKEKVNGYVWNVTDAHGNTPAGTNYAWSDDTQTWDALGGTIDLSPYALKTELTGATNTLQNNIDAVDEKADANAQALADYKTEVSSTYETKNNVTTAITAAKDSVYASATTAAATDATTKANSAKTDAINAAAASAKTLNSAIEAVDDRVDELSGVTKTVKATADSAIQTASADEASKVSITKEGTELKFDFSNLVIDCGEF